MGTKILEIRWHGRGGQGVKTAALLFGEAAMATGKHFQAFPEYGPERMGAPVQAFNRLADSKIELHCGIKEPQVVVVLDPTLLETQSITDGLKPDGMVIINTVLKPNQLREKLSLKPTQKVFTVDASGISRKTLGKELPNTPMLGALVKVTQIVSLDELIFYIRDRLKKKFDSKVVESNIQSIKEAYTSVNDE
jgi:pyruvate ferredoxin oxidoreductase gamma subunit